MVKRWSCSLPQTCAMWRTFVFVCGNARVSCKQLEYIHTHTLTRTLSHSLTHTPFAGGGRCCAACLGLFDSATRACPRSYSRPADRSTRGECAKNGEHTLEEYRTGVCKLLITLMQIENGQAVISCGKSNTEHSVSLITTGGCMICWSAPVAARTASNAASLKTFPFLEVEVELSF